MIKPEHYKLALEWLNEHPNLIDALPSREETAIKSALELAIKAALSRAASPSIPEGYCLVPIEPTDDMIAMAVQSYDVNGKFALSSHYKAMIYAAPQPPKETL